MNGQTLVICGGSGALGSAVARIATAQGARIISLDARSNPASGAIEQHRIDLCDAPAVAALFAQLPPFDALCITAGGFAMGAPVHAPDDTEWETMFARNVATLRCVLKAAVPRLLAQNHGHIVCVGALAAVQGKAHMSAYTAAKAVVMNLTESLAAELAATPIRVNAVLPSIIDTPANRADMPDAARGGWVAADDLARLICFLASDESRAVHGALIPAAGRQGG